MDFAIIQETSYASFINVSYYQALAQAILLILELAKITLMTFDKYRKV
jgi:hypothetical protein